MYSCLDIALRRIFGKEEELIGKNPIGKMIVANSWREERTGFSVPYEDRLKPEHRIASDGRAKKRLRAVMTPLMFAVLVLRYSEDISEKKIFWLKLEPILRQDEGLPKAVRNNPVILRLFLGWHIQSEVLRSGKVDFKGSRMTVWRLNKACYAVANRWIMEAEDEAERRLEELGFIK